MTRRGPIAVATCIALAITVAAGVLHGRQTHRWGTPHELTRAAGELNAFSRTVGQWETIEEDELPPITREVLHDPGYVLRSYRNRFTGETVKLAVLVGAPGPIAVHTPELCYSSTAYKIIGEPTGVTIRAQGGKERGEFWKLHLEPQGPADPPLVVYYAWGTGEEWVAARNPRLSYGNRAFLYKLQLAAVQPPPPGRSDGDAGQRFLQDLLASDVHLPVAD